MLSDADENLLRLAHLFAYKQDEKLTHMVVTQIEKSSIEVPFSLTVRLRIFDMINTLENFEKQENNNCLQLFLTNFTVLRKHFHFLHTEQSWMDLTLEIVIQVSISILYIKLGLDVSTIGDSSALDYINDACDFDFDSYCDEVHVVFASLSELIESNALHARSIKHSLIAVTKGLLTHGLVSIQKHVIVSLLNSYSFGDFQDKYNKFLRQLQDKVLPRPVQLDLVLKPPVNYAKRNRNAYAFSDIERLEGRKMVDSDYDLSEYKAWHARLLSCN